LEQWALQLCGFDFSIIHCQGSQNQHADELSGRPVMMVAIRSDLDHTVIAAAQRSDSVLQMVIQQREAIPHRQLEDLLEEIPSNLVSTDFRSVCTVPQGEDSSNAGRETIYSVTNISAETMSKGCP